MRCETSFFSLTLYKKHLTRNWPLWAVWMALWMLIIPVQVWNRHLQGDRARTQAFLAAHPKDCVAILIPLLAFTAALVAVAVFFHLFKSNSANFIGALPLRREGVFLTAFAAGYTMLLGPLVAVTLVTLGLGAILGCFSPTIFMFLGAAALNSFFWLSFAALCCVISGHAVAAVAFYFIFNWIVPVMTALVEGLLSGFLYGFVGFGDKFYEAMAWLCPVYHLTVHQWYNPWGFDDWNMLAIYAAVGFLMALAALGLHHIRKAERSGDLIAFVPIKWLFKICVTICGGMGLGTFLTIVIFNSVYLDDLNGWKFGVCCAVAAFVCYMVAEMLLAKSFKVWKHWKGALISAVAFILVVAAVDMDWIGFTTRVPEASSVRSATASFSGTGMFTAADNGLKFTGEDVKAITDLHQYLVTHRDEDDGSAGSKWVTLQLNYDLGWASLRRRYNASYAPGSEMDRLVDAALTKGDIAFPFDKGTPNYVSFDACVFDKIAGNDDNKSYIGREILTEDIKTVWDAVTADVAAGRYQIKTNGDDDLNTGTLYAQWYTNGVRTSYELMLTPDLTETWAVLERLGYFRSDAPAASFEYEVIG